MKFVFGNIIFFLLMAAASGVFAQQGLNMKSLEIDSTEIEFEKQNEYRRLVSGISEGELFMEKIELPKFDISQELYKRNSLSLNLFSFKNLPLTGFSTGFVNPGYSPFYQNGTILSEGAYQLGSKFVVGGYSYGINSMFSAPLPNQGASNFDRYGSTMFLQYKVSKNFKIETRVNVSQGAHPPGF